MDEKINLNRVQFVMDETHGRQWMEDANIRFVEIYHSVLFDPPLEEFDEEQVTLLASLCVRALIPGGVLVTKCALEDHPIFSTLLKTGGDEEYVVFEKP